MKYFAHSINNVSLIDQLAPELGVEIEIRDKQGKLVLGHDPLQNDYQCLESYLDKLNGRPIIANIKSERLEEPFINLLERYSPNSDYFFLDSSLSMIINKGKDYNFASRFSEYESLKTSINLMNSSLVKWIWVDTFTKFPIEKNMVETFNSLNLQKCLTSPDLLGRKYDIEDYSDKINSYGINFDAICCKKENVKKWKNLLN